MQIEKDSGRGSNSGNPTHRELLASLRGTTNSLTQFLPLVGFATPLLATRTEQSPVYNRPAFASGEEDYGCGRIFHDVGSCVLPTRHALQPVQAGGWIVLCSTHLYILQQEHCPRARASRGREHLRRGFPCFESSRIAEAAEEGSKKIDPRSR